VVDLGFDEPNRSPVAFPVATLAVVASGIAWGSTAGLQEVPVVLVNQRKPAVRLEERHGC